jgi:Tol biopolymer transport system component
MDTAIGRATRHLVDYATRPYGTTSRSRDGRTLVYAALSEGRMQLLAISAVGGEPHQLTHDDGNLLLPGVSPRGMLIAATRLVHREEIWRVALPR